MPVTIKDIAKKCGVSEGTVDRALNGRCGIRQETKELILKTAEEMNYQSNHLASCLAKGKTMNIGVICAHLTNTFFSQLIEEIEKMAYANGYYITLVLTHNSVEKELEGIKYLAKRQVDGIIVFPIGYGEDYEKEILSYKIPIVTIYNKISEKFDHVDVDCHRIMRNAVSFIVSKGYKRVAYLDPGYDRPDDGRNRYSLNQRRFGYIDGMKDESLGEPVLFAKLEPDEIIEFINESEDKPAILCPFDNVAIRLINALKDRGIKTPEDVGIMGFDNIPMLEWVTPRIYSVDCGIKELGRKAFNVLLRKIEGEENVGDCIAAYRFTEGESL